MNDPMNDPMNADGSDHTDLRGDARHGGRRPSRHTRRNLAVFAACAIAVPAIVFVGSSSPGTSSASAPSTLAPLEIGTATDDVTPTEDTSPPEDTAPPENAAPTEDPAPPEDPTSSIPDADEPNIESAPVVPEDLPTISSAEAAAMRADLDAYLVELLEVVEDYDATLRADAPDSLDDTDYLGAVATARGLVAGLDDVEVQALHQMVETPMWAEQPDRLQHVVDVSPFNGDGGATIQGSSLRSAATTAETVARFDAVPATPLGPFAASPAAPAGLLSNCQGTQPSLRGLFYSYWAAAQVAGAAGAVASGLPDADVYWPFLIAAGVVFGVANGIAIALDHALTLALDCEDAKSDAEREQSLPTEQPVADPPVYVRGSTQASIDVLIAIVGGIQAQLEIIEANVLAQLDRQLEVINALGQAQASASFIRATAADTQVRTADLLERVGRPADSTTSTANGLANTIEDRLDTILRDTASFRALNLRLSIERNLADPEHVPIGLFTLPSAFGGELDTVRDLVAVVIDDLEAAGQGTNNAQALLATANASFAAGDYARAYTEYAMAYRAAVR